MFKAYFSLVIRNPNIGIIRRRQDSEIARANRTKWVFFQENVCDAERIVISQLPYCQ